MKYTMQQIFEDIIASKSLKLTLKLQSKVASLERTMAAGEHQRKIKDIFAKKISSQDLRELKVPEQEEEMQTLDNESSLEIQVNSQTISPIAVQLGKYDKHDKLKGKLNRELGDLSDNEILPTRLRSSSGRVYSTGMMINTGAINNDNMSSLPDGHKNG